MEHRNRNIRSRRVRQGQWQGRARCPVPPGFTILELMAVILVMGILTAAVIANWSTFMRHQDLRGDAINLHKEILALKARAVQNDDTAYIDAVLGGSACTLKYRYETDAGVSTLFRRVIQLKKDVLIDTAVDVSLPSGDLAKLSGGSSSKNYWMGPNVPAPFTTSSNSVRILIHPDTLRADPTRAFMEGRITLRSNLPKVTSRYCIQKDSTCMKPEIYYKQSGATWKRL